MTEPLAIIGAGLCGNLLALLLSRQGIELTVFERGTKPTGDPDPGGRSINLALAARGIRALQQARVFDDVEPLLLPMAGRIVHDLDGRERNLPYGQGSDEKIWSVSRHELNRTLYEAASRSPGVRYRFGHQCLGIDDEPGVVLRHNEQQLRVAAPLVIAADGAGSAVRRSLQDRGLAEVTEDMLDHGYKELLIPPTVAGDFALDPNGLHIWPRGGFMLIALPNLDRSFTATLFLPRKGKPGFDTTSPDNVTELFAEQFNDVLPLIPNLATEFASRPVGTLGTVRCRPWQFTSPGRGNEKILLTGDAAHAIVPFHGQGMNAAFEDCAEIDRLVTRHKANWGTILDDFEAARQDNATAIADMALENYREMRDTVRDEKFAQRAQLAFELERRYPGRFIPRYSMVMFHPEISYAEAQRRGAAQAAILDAALTEASSTSALSLACRLVEQQVG